MTLTQKLIRELFDYRDGNLYWKIRRQGIKIGDKAGSLKNSGYYSVGINGKLYNAHRLIYLYHHGYLPEFLDHIDGNPSNNKIENLREVTKSQNSMNRKPDKNTSSKYKGVSWAKQNQKWKAQIKINGKVKHLGYFTNEDKAAIAYNKVAKKHFGEYACLNKI